MSPAGSFDVTAILRQGVYLLSREGRVVYIGQSRCMLIRIYAHRNLARKRVPHWLPIRGVVFDTVEVIPCHPDRVDDLERGLIALHRPVHNRDHNPDYPPPKLPPPSPRHPPPTYLSHRL
jgi:hypothetical protein